MADTIRTQAAILALFADNFTGEISPQDLRDFVVSTWRPEDGVYAYLSTPAETTCTDAGTYYFIEGTFTNEVLECWEIAPPLTYLGCDGNDGYKFKINVHASFTSDTGGNLIRMALYKNGELQTNSIMASYIKLTAEETTISTVDVLSFDIGDTLDIRVSASRAGSKLTAVNLTTSASRFF
jgi:hypothetical protein